MEKWIRLLESDGSESRLTQGNQLTLFTGGDASFRAMWDDIRQAQQRVWLETYTFAPDAVGQRTIRELTDAFCLVGSHNLDRWSDLHNLEVSVAAVDSDLAARLAETFRAYVERSEPYTMGDWQNRPLYRRALQWMSYALMQI